MGTVARLSDGCRYSARMETEPIEKGSNLERIAVYLTPDEALVLDAFLKSRSGRR
jgi:hypothetical protein